MELLDKAGPLLEENPLTTQSIVFIRVSISSAMA
jgi:hypothetical protein